MTLRRVRKPQSAEEGPTYKYESASILKLFTAQTLFHVYTLPQVTSLKTVHTTEIQDFSNHFNLEANETQ